MSNITNAQKLDCTHLILKNMKAERPALIESGLFRTWLANQIYIMESVVADYRELSDAE